MARNCEKNYGRLNRLWLDKEIAKKAKRPRLSSLTTPAEISEWLPSIKDEIDFCLKQSEVRCYTDKKIAEYRQRVVALEMEYKSFLRKLRRLDSSVTVAPWTARAYEKKPRSRAALPILHPVNDATDCNAEIKFLETPILFHDRHYGQGSSTATCSYSKSEEPIPSSSCNPDQPPDERACLMDLPLFPLPSSIGLDSTPSVNSKTSKIPPGREPNVLGLCYSSSDED